MQKTTLQLIIRPIVLLIAINFCAFAQHIPYYKAADLLALKNNKSDTVYVLNFWATWCKPCLEELPDFEKLTQAYADKKVKVILASNDFSKQIETRLKPFVKQQNLKSLVVFINEKTPNDWMPFISEEWDGNIPATLIVKGSIGFYMFVPQQMNYEDLEKIIKPIID
jgi:thiol-disulfide isomerase/thioredoxin